MTNQTKKKRPDELPNPPPDGQKPIQLQRRRVWRACESCRRKKIKCDGNEPTCTQCSTSGSQCTWLQTKDRAALSRHYVQELEARLIHMEALFTQVAPILEQSGQLPPGLAADGQVSMPPMDRSDSAAGANIGHDAYDQDLSLNATLNLDDLTAEPSLVKLEAEDDSDFSESFGQLALDEHGHMRWIGGSSTMSLINSFRHFATAPYQPEYAMEDDPRVPGFSVNKLYFPSSVFFGKVRALPYPEDVEYPERDLADLLIDTYFSRLHFLMPVIDKPTFLQKYKYLMDNLQDISVHRAETAFIALVFSVFACAARLVTDPRLASKPGDDEEGVGMGMVYYERALILHYISHASIQLAHVQCFYLMSAFLCSVNCLPQAWLLIGQALRSSQDLGLHRSPRRLGIGPVDKETRRKIWWSVYTMDRMLAVALGRPIGIEDRDCDVELPLAIDDDDLPSYFQGVYVAQDRPTLMTGFLALISLYKIAGRILRQVYALENCREHLEPERRAELNRTVEALDRDLTKWGEGLPPIFKLRPVNDRDIAMGAVLCSHYFSLLSTLHRNFLPVKREQPAAARSVSKAVSSARSFINLASSIKTVVPPSHHLAFFIQTLFSSAVVVLLYAMRVTDVQGIEGGMQQARHCLSILHSWEGQWPGARKCRELLNDLVNTASEAIKSSPNGIGGMNGGQTRPSVPPTSAAPGAVNPPSSPRASSERWGQHGPVQMGGAGRAVRNKPRRDKSHDPYQHSRQSSRSGANFRDTLAQRARSASRKRPYDEPAEPFEAQPPYPSVLPYPAGVSSHSSPQSVRSAPSPREHSADTPPSHQPRQQSPKLASPRFGVAPIHVSSPPRPFEYNFGMSQSQPSSAHPINQPAPTSPPAAQGTDPWSSQGHSRDASSLIYMPSGSGSQDSNPSSMLYGLSSAPPSSGFDASFYGYEGAGDQASPSGLLGGDFASFSTPGLPFPALDFIRNYPPDGYNMNGDEPLWQGIDPGAFRYEPDVPWTLGDSVEQSDGQRHQ